MQCFSASINLYLTVDQGQVRRPAVSAARSFDQGFAHLYQVLPDGDMLGTGFLAFSALDAFVRPFQPMSAYKPSLLILCQGGIAVESQIIHGREGSRDADIHGAHLRTVITGRTGDQRNPFQLFLGLGCLKVGHGIVPPVVGLGKRTPRGDACSQFLVYRGRAGKTTTIGKLAKRIKDSGKSVMMVAADTFRAGAVEQLVEWGRRDGVEVITGPEKADPASVVYDGVKKAKERGIDFLLVDTAGRLQNKVNLMSELDKIKRTIKKILPDQPNEVLLVLDGSTGQNALLQAKDFDKTTKLTGLVLTKLDGSSKGGVVLAIRNEMDLPVKLVGLGEKVDDLANFDAEKFAIGLFQGLI